jgi:hypothetical protein
LTYRQIIRILIHHLKTYLIFIFSGKLHPKTHGRAYRFFNRQSNYLKHDNNLSNFVDYTSITCRFSIPVRLPEVICVNVIIFNRDNNDSITTTTLIKNVSLQQILQLIEYHKQFNDLPILPMYSATSSSPTTIQNTTNDDSVITQNDDDEPINHNIVVLDEKLL